MTPSGRDKNIDSILTLFDAKILTTRKDIENLVGSETFNSIEQMRLIGLIEQLGYIISEGGECYILTSFGIEVKRAGSWTKHQKNKDEEREINRLLIASSIRTNWLQKWLLIATTVFSFITLGVSTADIIIQNKELQVANEELRLHKLEIQKQQDAKDTSSLKKSYIKADSSNKKNK